MGAVGLPHAQMWQQRLAVVSSSAAVSSPEGVCNLGRGTPSVANSTEWVFLKTVIVLTNDLFYRLCETRGSSVERPVDPLSPLFDGLADRRSAEVIFDVFMA